MTDQPLKEQGLLSVKELWVNIYPPEDPLPDYGSVGSVNRPVRSPASGGDPHAGRRSRLSGCGSPEASKCGEGELKAPLYPIGPSVPPRTVGEQESLSSRHGQDRATLCHQ